MTKDTSDNYNEDHRLEGRALLISRIGDFEFELRKATSQALKLRAQLGIAEDFLKQISVLKSGQYAQCLVLAYQALDQIEEDK